MKLKNIVNKFLIFCAIFFCALPCFAEDNVRRANNYNTLAEAVEYANTHQNKITTIQVTHNITFEPTDDPLIITTNTVLTSAGGVYTITGNNANTQHMFTFQGASSTISNINFSSSTANNPAVMIDVNAVAPGQKYSTFTIDNVTFSNNTSYISTGGGALNINSHQGTSLNSVTFTTNTAAGIDANGGALYYQGEIGFTGNNITASYNTAAQNGGAIYASSATLTNSKFSNNTAAQNGGAIYISSGTIQYSTFTENTAQNGGAVFASSATLTNSRFYNNTAIQNGGAIYITDTAKIKNIRFLRNQAIGNGGAIYNNVGSTTSILSTTFSNNQATGNGGAVYNDVGSTTNISSTVFNGNISECDGGAIYTLGDTNITKTNFSNNTAANGGAIYIESSTATINGLSNFTGNHASDDGGAIYATNNAIINLNPDGNTVTFSGNTASGNDNDIYLDNSSALNINGGGTVNFHGGVQGSSGNIISASSTTINWYASNGFGGTFNVTDGALNISGSTSDFHDVTLNGATLNLQGNPNSNDFINSFSADSLTLTGEVPLFIDVNLDNNQADSVNFTTNDGSGRFVINSAEQLQILGNFSGTIDFNNITSAALSVNQNEEFVGPIYIYSLQEITGGFSMTSGRFNPTVLALPVAANSKVVANINTVNSLYNRIDVMLSREYLEYQNRSGLRSNPYIQMLEEEIDDINKKISKEQWPKMTWFIPNSGYQKVDFGNDIGEVKNTFYGGLAGVDFPYWLSDNSALIPTVFMGYLGSNQKYIDATLNNDSFAFGGMLTYMKDFAILSAQAYIANGTEKYSFRRYSGNFDVFSFTSSVKGELNLNIFDNIVIQPAFTATYNMSNLQDYTTANYANIHSSRFHNILLTPAIKLMIDADGWYPYAGVSYNLSQKQKGSFNANDLTIAEYKLKNFGEFSIGIENTFLKTYSGYVQVSAYTGSSKGVSFQMGLRGYLD